jgi:alkylation response protein AidB-like acyl-CoA dehydrogenase
MRIDLNVDGHAMPPTNFSTSINILGATLVEFGAHERKLVHVPNILSGRELWLQFLSEPRGGSGLAGLLTTVLRDSNSYVVNRQKIRSTAAPLSDFAQSPVRTRWDIPKHKGTLVLIVDLKSPGLEIRRIKQIGGGSEFCEELFTGVIIPRVNLLNEEWRVASNPLEIEYAWIDRGGASAGGTYEIQRNTVSERGLRSRGIRHSTGTFRSTRFHTNDASGRSSQPRVSGTVVPVPLGRHG